MPGRRLKDLLLLFILSILLTQSSVLANRELGAPFIKNYYPSDYNGSAQNWAIVQDSNGVMHFGNDDGYTLEFDGQHWKKSCIMPNSLWITALAIDKKGIIYVGTTDELGYLKPDKTGQMKYISLTDKLNKEDRIFGSIWWIHATTHGIYYLAIHRTFRLFNGKIENINILPKAPPLNSSKINDDVIFVSRGGLCLLKEGKPYILPHTLQFAANARYIQIFPYPDNKILIVTSSQGCYIYDLPMLSQNKILTWDLSKTKLPPKTILKKFPTEIDEYIIKNTNYCGTPIDNDHYAIGTKSGGIIIMNHKGKLVRIINKHRGLPNRVVHCIYAEKNGNLWVGLNGLISYIETGSPISQFKDLSGLEAVVISAARYRGRLYVGDFKGIHYLQDYQPEITNDKHVFVPITRDNKACATFIKIHDVLLAGGEFGVIGIGPKGIFQESRTKGLVYSFCQSKKFPNHVFAALDDPGGIAAVKIEPGAFRFDLIETEKFQQIKYSIEKIISDSQGNLWLTTINNGILYLRFSGKDITDFELFHYTTKNGLPQKDYNFVHLRNNYLVLGTNKGIFQSAQPVEPECIPDKLHFVPQNTYGQWFNQNLQPVLDINFYKDGSIWVNAKSKLFNLILTNDGTYVPRLLPLQKTKSTKFGHFLLEENGIVWLCSPKGLFHYDSTKKKDYQTDYPSLIRKVTIGKKQVIFNGNYGHGKSPTANGQGTILKYTDNRVIFEYAAPFYEFPQDTRFSYILEGMQKNWSDWTADVKKEYTNLMEGKYNFKVKAKNIFGHVSQMTSYEFKILPPWHRSIFAFLGYLCIFVTLVYVGIRFYTRRLLAAKIRLEKIVKERTSEVVAQKDEILVKNKEITEKSAEISAQKSQLEKANQELNRLATIDGLTGIANHRFFLEFLENEWMRSIRSKQPLSVILIDVDFFKLFNDTYGHQSGDECLKRVAKALKDTVKRPTDLVARYGGEEFIIILSETDTQGARKNAEKARTNVENLQLLHEASKAASHITISLGLATIIPTPDFNSANLITAADKALYQSKENGRNRFTAAERVESK